MVSKATKRTKNGPTPRTVRRSGVPPNVKQWMDNVREMARNDIGLTQQDLVSLVLTNRGQFRGDEHLKKVLRGKRYSTNHQRLLSEVADVFAARSVHGYSAEYYLNQIFRKNQSIVQAEDVSKHREPEYWTLNFDNEPLQRVFVQTTKESEDDLYHRLVDGCHSRFNAFGLTRNFYVTSRMSAVLADLAKRVPVTIYLMDPDSLSRIDRYRIEPLEAALEEPRRFRSRILSVYGALLKSTNATTVRPDVGLRVFLYNFPCSFCIEEIDQTYRVMLYGHGKRGTEGPIFVFDGTNPYTEYFGSQLRWLEKLASGELQEQSRSHGIRVTAFVPPKRM